MAELQKMKEIAEFIVARAAKSGIAHGCLQLSTLLIELARSAGLSAELVHGFSVVVAKHNGCRVKASLRHFWVRAYGRDFDVMTLVNILAREDYRPPADFVRHTKVKHASEHPGIPAATRAQLRASDAKLLEALEFYKQHGFVASLEHMRGMHPDAEEGVKLLTLMLAIGLHKFRA